jgi:hypothetical protein
MDKYVEIDVRLPQRTRWWFRLAMERIKARAELKSAEFIRLIHRGWRLKYHPTIIYNEETSTLNWSAGVEPPADTPEGRIRQMCRLT